MAGSSKSARSKIRSQSKRVRLDTAVGLSTRRTQKARPSFARHSTSTNQWLGKLCRCRFALRGQNHPYRVCGQTNNSLVFSNYSGFPYSLVMHETKHHSTDLFCELAEMDVQLKCDEIRLYDGLKLQSIKRGKRSCTGKGRGQCPVIGGSNWASCPHLP